MNEQSNDYQDGASEVEQNEQDLREEALKETSV